MNPRATRWLLFFTLAFTLPLPMLGPFAASVPAVRFLILAGWSAAVGVVEGAEGPVLGILLLFVAHAVFGLLLCWLLAWAVARLLAHFPTVVRTTLVLAAVLVAFFLALSFDLYETPFGRAATSNLIGVLS